MSGPDAPLRPDAEPRPTGGVHTADSAETIDVETVDNVETPDGPGTDERTAGAPRRRRRRVKRRSWARRRHLGRITVGAVVLALAAGLAVVVLTWDSGRTPPSAQAATVARTTPTVAATAPTPTAVAGAPVAVTVRGEVTAVGDRQYTMETRTGLTYTVVVTASTAFTRDRTFDDYAVGNGIGVAGSLDAAVLTATTISPAAPN